MINLYDIGKNKFFIAGLLVVFILVAALFFKTNNELFRGKFTRNVISPKNTAVKICGTYLSQCKSGDQKYCSVYRNKCKEDDKNVLKETLPEPVSRTIKILGVRVTSSVPDQTDVSTEELRNILFGATDSVKTYFEENSYNTMQIKGDVLSYPLPINHPVIDESGSGGTNYSQLLESLDEYVDFRDYDIFLFILLQGGVCTGSASSIGAAPYDSQEGRVAIGYIAVTAECVNNFADNNIVPVILHEIGHLLGLKHAATWLPMPSCENIPLNNLFDASCINYYGGGTIMGAARGDLYAFQRKKISTLSDTSYNTINESGDYWLYYWRDREPSQYEELRIPLSNGYYSVEFRRNIIREIENGITINFIPNSHDFFADAIADVFIPDTLLVKPPAYALTASNPSFIDSLRDITIAISSIEENRALINVSIE